MVTYQLHFVRHGLTTANIKGKFSGSTDDILSEKGISQLNTLKSNFLYPNAEILYCSPRIRCVSTAEILYPELKAILNDGLAEWNFGIWEGKTTADLKNDKKFIQWIKNSSKIAPEGGESQEVFGNRISATFENIVNNTIKNHYKNSVIVTHGGVIGALLTKYGIPKANLYDWIADNGCGFSVRIDPSLWMRQKVVEVYNTIPAGLHKQNKENLSHIVNLIKSMEIKN